MSILFYVGLMLLCGLLAGRIAKLVGFPNVTGYIVAGLIIGPHILGIISLEATEGIGIVSEMALGFIALSIGAEFELSYFKEVGKTPVIIALLEGTLAIVFVTVTLLAFGYDLPIAVMLGAIASATAPAATIMVIRQYRANGPVTKTLLSVVALDDAVALIAFGFAIAVTKSFKGGSSDLLITILDPFITLFLSIIIGVLFALILLIDSLQKGIQQDLCNRGVVFLTLTLPITLVHRHCLYAGIRSGFCKHIERRRPVFRIADSVTPPSLCSSSFCQVPGLMYHSSLP